MSDVVSEVREPQSFRDQVGFFVQNPLFEKAIIALILINAITLGLETVPSIASDYGTHLKALDHAILSIFIMEISLRLFHNFKGFWRDPWRIFDFVVVGIALVPASGSLSVLRAFRILRVLRLVSTIPSLRRVVSGLLSALPGMGSIVFLLFLVFYVFAVICTKLFAIAFPEWFGSIGASAFTLFQIMTLESWSMGVARPVMEEFPYAWAIFIPFIVVTAFTVLNLFIGVIVNAMQTEQELEAKAEREKMKAQSQLILDELRGLRAERQAKQRQ
ncbi:MAG: ion transporter [Rhizobiaceae bacterium]|nr:ion transporter [Rhizobiaceae bacterium]